MKKIKQYFPIVLIVLSSFLPVLQAQDIPDPMNPPRLVNDFASFLSQNEAKQLEGKLRQFNNQTSTQIYIVILKDLKGYAPGDFAVRLAEKWGVGQKGKNNGIVILVKPKTIESRGEVFISTGYGLEGVVPDAIANRIVDNEIIPAFKAGAFYGGLDQAVNVLISLTKGEFTAEDYRTKTEGGSGGSGIFGLIFMGIIFISIFG
ncbi:MAG: TPM domain-containing protein, partial [Bacteroidota bacterium]|nr:TPM domain-containing protein [Bacteroidota bacterium]